jgi:phenylalanyl-tRNA synthetase alpha chain
MSDLEQLILSTLATAAIEDSWAFAEAHHVDHQAVVGAVKSLLVDAYVADEALTTSFWVLTDEGADIVAKGSPEYQVYQAVPAEAGGITVAQLNALCGDVAKIGLGAAMKSKWLKKDGDSILRAAASVVDETAAQLASVAAGTSTLSEDDLKNLKRRKLVNQVVRKSFKLTKGPEYQPVRTRR